MYPQILKLVGVNDSVRIEHGICIWTLTTMHLDLPDELEHSVGGRLSRRSLIACFHIHKIVVTSREMSKDTHITATVGWNKKNDRTPFQFY